MSGELIVRSEEEFDRRVSQMTGLSVPEAQMYYPFCHHADWKNGVIMHGDVTHDLFQEVKVEQETLSY